MSTIRDIAKHARGSVATASLALNGDSRVREATRERVLEVVRRLDYYSSRAARSLSSGLTWSIHLLNPFSDSALSSGFFSRFSYGVHDLAREQGYTVAFSVLEDEAEAEAVLKRLIYERWADGVILLNPTSELALLDVLSAAAFPHVVLGRGAKDTAMSVDNDNKQVGFDAAWHLLERARAPVLFLNGPAHHTFTHDRARGYRAALEQAGLEPDPALLHFLEGTADAAYTRLGELLDQHLGFRALMTASDAQAVGTLRLLRERGLRVPQDVALIGMNNDDLTSFTAPSLSSVELGAYELGRQSVELLLTAVREGAETTARWIVPHRLVARESS
ncbi:MAG: LacI family transcriptional regulator [Deinococcota bacterium]|nr:LacI family transcriptional regulator [Deinococcota bacterium]